MLWVRRRYINEREPEAVWPSWTGEDLIIFERQEQDDFYLSIKQNVDDSAPNE